MKPYLWHLSFDLVSFLFSLILIRFELHRAPRLQAHSGYWIMLCVGAVIGAYFFGSFNLSLEKMDLRLGHSIAGALFGGIFFVECYKWIRGIRYSTGAIFVIPITVGIIIGRWGCFMAGLTDQTFGVPSTLPWAVDFGDGIGRHPVQIYESVSMMVFLVFILVWRKKYSFFYSSLAFYFFIFFYSLQRFCWEFLKPYTLVFFNFNVFHFVCLGLMIYSLTMLKIQYASANTNS